MSIAHPRHLRLEHDMPVIVVSSHDTLDERLRAFAAGADDFISKPAFLL